MDVISVSSFRCELRGVSTSLERDSDSPELYNDDSESLMESSVTVSDDDVARIHYDHPTQSLPVFPDSSLTVFESHVLLFHYFTKHHLTSQTLDDLIQVLKHHMPKKANIPSSYYKLKKFFKKLYPDLAVSVHFTVRHATNCS